LRVDNYDLIKLSVSYCRQLDFNHKQPSFLLTFHVHAHILLFNYNAMCSESKMVDLPIKKKESIKCYIIPFN